MVDPDEAAASRLARDFGGVAHASVAAALAAGGFDRAHVLVPPDLHAEAARPLLAAGIPVLLEKPLASDGAQAEALVAEAAASGAALGVNQNFVHHPAFVRLRAMLDAGTYGRPRFVGCVYNAAVRQMATRQFGHWMFRAPVNILLEQAVHPLSQILALAGPVRDMAALAGAPIEISPGVPFTPDLSVSLACARLPAQLRFAVGQSFPFWQVSVVCDDGVRGGRHPRRPRVHTGPHALARAGRALEAGLRTGAADRARQRRATSACTGRRNCGCAAARTRSSSACAPASPPSTTPSMRAARRRWTGGSAPDLVALCERMRDQAFPAAAGSAPAADADSPPPRLLAAPGHPP